jgi:predicted  nucleic acid-binding Zn-ribbon protein
MTLRANLASARPAPGNFRREAKGRGYLSTDFCINDCMGATGNTVTANIYYEIAYAGRMSTFGPFTKARFQLIGDIIEVGSNQAVAIDVLVDEEVGGGIGAVKKIAGVPIPIPSSEGIKTVDERVFQAQLKIGQKYRFRVRAFGVATTPALNGGIVVVNFTDVVDGIGPNGLSRNGGVTVETFRIEVGSDASSDIIQLTEAVEMLQNALNQLSVNTTSQNEAVSDQLTDVELQIASLQDQITDLLEADIPNIRSEVEALKNKDTVFESNLAGFGSDLVGLETNLTIVAAQMDQLLSDFAALSIATENLESRQSTLESDLAALNSGLQELETKHDLLQEAFSGHSHDYLTGSGSGHNNTKVRTSPPN